MSRWLNKVGNFLEKLDDQAEKVVDERLLVAKGTDDEEDATFENMRVATILAARGLDSNEEEEEEETEVEDIKQEGTMSTRTAEEASRGVTVGGETSADDDSSQTPVEDSPHHEDEAQPKEPQEGKLESSNTASEGTDEAVDATTTDTAENSDGNSPEEEPSPEDDATETDAVSEKPTDVKLSSDDAIADADANNPSPETTESQPLLETPPTTAGSNPLSNATAGSNPIPVVVSQTTRRTSKTQPRTSKSTKASSASTSTTPNNNTPQLRQVQKETRTLRRQVLQLHSQLERAEAEVQAQRDELDRAAERIEKDRARHKADREVAQTRHQAEMKVLQENHDKALLEQKQRADALLEETRQQLRDLEQRHVQEGGDWNKELGSAVEREQQMIERTALLEDERATLLSQISTLQAQQEALGSRLESLTETADNALVREREADDRLDEALSLHARQISQRNSRETQLEQTVAELGAALVAAKQKTKEAVAAAINSNNNNGSNDSSINAAASKDDAISLMQQEMETLQGQLAHEHQRNETLQQELREVTRERTDEVSMQTTLQLEYDRRVSTMSHEIAELRRQLRQEETAASESSNPSADDKNNSQQQLQSLSEEVLKQREAVITYKSEVSALKSRLKVALHRAEQAEDRAQAAVSAAASTSDVERGGIPQRRNRRRRRAGVQGSMKAAFRLDSTQSESKLGSVLDLLDDAMGKSGSVLRINPIARFLFVLYLLILHLWTFLLLMFHAHGSFETDYGGMPHGPQTLLLPPHHLASTTGDNNLQNPVAADTTHGK